jgi:hypothetical protein
MNTISILRRTQETSDYDAASGKFSQILRIQQFLDILLQKEQSKENVS